MIITFIHEAYAAQFRNDVQSQGTAFGNLFTSEGKQIDVQKHKIASSKPTNVDLLHVMFACVYHLE